MLISSKYFTGRAGQVLGHDDARCTMHDVEPTERCEAFDQRPARLALRAQNDDTGGCDKTVRFGADWLSNNGPGVRFYRTESGPVILQARNGQGSEYEDAAFVITPGTACHLGKDTAQQASPWRAGTSPRSPRATPEK